MAALSVKLASAMRSYPGETVSGDAWAADWQDGSCRIAVIDGLGHGPLAAIAADRAVEVLHANPGLAPVEALMACHGALVGTRGAAISIALLAANSTQLTWAGIGNVDGQLWQDSKGKRLTPDRGIVGTAHRSINLQTVGLVPPWILLLHSDGVSARFDASSLDDGTKRDPQAMADAILARWGRERDDATIVVACSVDPDLPAE
jgi:Stage II sporulation protein E (SpoIIE)